MPKVKKMDLGQGMGQKALEIARILQNKGFIAYFAGGCVRDHLMGDAPQDFDIATTATPDQVEKLFDKTVPVGKQFGVMLVVREEDTFEVATFRTEGGYVDGRHPTNVSFSVPEEDAKRRDFTMNGIFYDPVKEEIIDFVQGEKAIHEKQIVAIGDPKTRFGEDKLRLLRAIRFASTLGFEIEQKTWSAVQEQSDTIEQVSFERIRDELVKLFTGPSPKRGYDLLSESGLMKKILPEIEAMKGVEQQPDWHPEGDVFIHTGLLLEKLERPNLVLVFAALFHDVGKPKTYKVRDGRITFYEHADIGAQMTEDIMKRLRFANDEIRDVRECVANHLKFGDVQKMRSGKLKRFVSRDTFEIELELHRIDCLSSHGMLDNYEFLKKKLVEYEQEDLKPDPYLNGRDLIDIGFEQGPRFKEILDQAYELQLEKEFGSRGEALDWLKKQAK